MSELNAWAIPTPDPLSIPPKPRRRLRLPVWPVDLIRAANVALILYVGALLENPLSLGAMLVGSLVYVVAEAYSRTSALVFKF